MTTMQLNTIAPAKGANRARRRVGRGIGSGLGKTAGRGHKGQKSRAGGYHKVGFEGGQMPLQRRLPKRGFKSHMQALNGEVSLAGLSQLASSGKSEIDIPLLRQAGLIGSGIERVKIVSSGSIAMAITTRGLGATAAAKAAIEAAGGSLDLPVIVKTGRYKSKLQRGA